MCVVFVLLEYLYKDKVGSVWWVCVEVFGCVGGLKMTDVC